MRDRAYAIRIIHCKGGGRTAIGATPEIARIEARIQTADCGGDYVLCTIPFPINRVDRPGGRLWDTSLPDDIVEGIGEEMAKLARKI